MADTLVSEIIVQAFREGNFTAVGEETTEEELMEAVPRLRNLISSLLGIEIGEALRDWYVPHEYDPEAPLRFPLTPTGTGATSGEPWQYPPANSRLVVAISTAKTVYFPAGPMDGARMAIVDVGSSADVTLNGNGRKIGGSTTITGAPADLNGKRWFYRADLADWLELTTLDENSSVPLPPEFDDLLVTGLCIRLAPRFGVEIQQVIADRYVDMLGRLRKRYKQSERQPTTSELRYMMRNASQGLP